MVKILAFVSRVLQVMAISRESARATFISQNLIPIGPLGADRLLYRMPYLQSEISRESLVHFAE